MPVDYVVARIVDFCCWASIYTEKCGHVVYAIMVLWSQVMRELVRIAKWSLFWFIFFLYAYVIYLYICDMFWCCSIFYMILIQVRWFIMSGPKNWRWGWRRFKHECYVIRVGLRHFSYHVEHEFMIVHWVLFHLWIASKDTFIDEVHIKRANTWARLQHFRVNFILFKNMHYVKEHEKVGFCFILLLFILKLVYTIVM